MALIRLSLVGIVLLFFSACEQPLETSGRYLTEAEANQIQRGMSKARVQELFGSPSYTSALDEDFWAYIGTKLQTRLFQNPEPIERRIVALDFSGGRVRDIVLVDLKDGRQVFPNADRTPTNGRTISLMEELLGNIGRF